MTCWDQVIHEEYCRFFFGAFYMYFTVPWYFAYIRALDRPFMKDDRDFLSTELQKLGRFTGILFINLKFPYWNVWFEMTHDRHFSSCLLFRTVRFVSWFLFLKLCSILLTWLSPWLLCLVIYWHIFVPFYQFCLHYMFITIFVGPFNSSLHLY